MAPMERAVIYPLIPARYRPLLAPLSNDTDIQLAVRILLISDAKERSLTEEELIDALAVDDDGQIFTEGRRETIRKALDVFRQCGFISKATVIAQGQEAPCWDASRNDYCVDVVTISAEQEGSALSEARWLHHAHSYLARICLIYLKSMAESKGRGSSQYAFRFYAARFWTTHAEKVERDEEDEDTALDSLLVRLEAFFLNSMACVDTWLQIYDDEDRQIREVSTPRRYDWVPAHRAPLFHAAFYGFRRAMKVLLSNEQEAAAVTSREIQEALHAACFRGRMLILQDLLSAGASANADYGPFETLLTASSAHGHGDIMQCLLTHGALFPDDVDDYHPLVVSAIAGHEHAVQIVTEHLTGLKRQQALDYTLMTLVKRFDSGGRDDVINVLLQTGADPMCTLEDEDKTPLEMVLMQGSPSTAKLLIGACNPERLRLASQQYLQLAMATGDTDLVWSLLLRTCQTDANHLLRFVDQARLIFAVKVGALDEVQSLLNKDPQWHVIQDRCGRSLLRIAVRGSRREIVDLLFRHMRSEQEQKTLARVTGMLHALLLEAVQISSIDTVNILLKHASELELSDCVTVEHLHAAVYRKDLDLFHLLLASIPADRKLGPRNEMGATILHTIAGAHHYNETELNNWAGPALVALLNRNPPLEEKDAVGRTPLASAVSKGNVKVVKILLENGARPENAMVDDIQVRRLPYADDIAACRLLLDP